ncbi:MAG: cyclic pyranopterin monophosphate synthase MoaC [Ostreibacterium sp.]
MERQLTHFDLNGHAHMVDIGDKATTERMAVAEGRIDMLPETLQLIKDKGHKKGDVLQVARLAGIMAAKKTADIIPLCHPISITHINIEFLSQTMPTALYCKATCKTIGQTGIEMEAIVACNTALLTIYDMCKAVDRGMTINGVRLLQKQGGKSGDFSVE